MVNYSYSTVGGIIKNYNSKNASNGKTAIAAVNGDMWLTHWALGDRGNLTAINKAKRDITISRSFNMVNGEIYTSETSRQEIAIETSATSQNSWSFGITEDYVPIFGQPHTVITVKDVNSGKTATADGINRFPVNNTLFIYTDRLMGTKRDFVQDDAYELLVEFGSDYTLGADSKVTGTVKAIYDSSTAENPPYLTNRQMVITARGSRISAVNSFKVGDTLEITTRVEDYAGDSERWGKVANAVSGSLPLVKDGAVKSAEIDYVASPGYPTTILGHDRAGKIVIITMDGRGVGGAGGSAARYKQLIKDYDLYNALLLDGGGSMTMVVATDTTYKNYKTVSTPSDGADRTIDDALILAFGPKRAAQGEFDVEDPYNTTDPLNITFPSETFVKAFKEYANQTEMTCEDGAMKLAVSGYDGSGETFDPYIILNFDKLTKKASADEYKYLTLVYKMPTTNSRMKTGPKYYGTEVCREYFSSNPKQFTYMTDQYEYVTFDMSGVSDWKDDVTKLRIDYMFASGADGDTMYIHNIILSKTQTAGEDLGKSTAERLNSPIPEETEPEETQPPQEGVKDPNTWLCNRGGPFFTGWWMGKSIDNKITDWEINVTFDTPNAFDSFIMACYASIDDPAVVSVKLLDKDGNELEGAGLTVVGNHSNDMEGYVTLRFSRAFAAGEYTLQFVYEEGSHFCLGSASVGDIDATVTGNGVTNSDTKAAPAIVLFGAVPPAEKEPVLSGDVNGDGDINNKDVVALFRFLSGGKPDVFVLDAADFNGDGEVNNKDVTALFRYTSSQK